MRPDRSQGVTSAVRRNPRTPTALAITLDTDQTPDVAELVWFQLAATLDVVEMVCLLPQALELASD